MVPHFLTPKWKYLIALKLVGRRKRQHPIDFGNATTFAETVDSSILIDYAHKILTKAKFFGICEVEFMYDARDNKYKFLEVNPRTWKWHLISEKAGIPFLLSLYKYFREGKSINKKKFKECGWRDIITDIPTKLTIFQRKIHMNDDSENIIKAVLNLKDLIFLLE